MIQRLLNIILKATFSFVKYRIHISLIFFFLLTYNNYRFSETLNYWLILSFTLWHFALFLFDRIYDREIDKISQPDEYVKEKDSSLLYMIVWLLVIASFIIYFFSGFSLIYWLILLPITILYPLKIYKNFRIKSVFLIKNLYSAFLIFCLPLLIQLQVLSQGNLELSSVKLPITSLFLYVLIGEVFWDIRDMTADKMNNTHTIPNTLGVGFTKLYILALILIDAYITGSFFSASAYIYFALLIFVKESTHRLVFHLPPLIALIRFSL